MLSSESPFIIFSASLCLYVQCAKYQQVFVVRADIQSGYLNVRMGFVHITQCRGFVTNGSNHWMLRQPDQVSKTETMARGTGEVITGCCK